MTLISSTFAYAELGGNLDSIQKDQRALRSQRTVTSHSQYDVHEMKNGRGHVHEFVGKTGSVFGLAWQGRNHPNLKTLMGAHYVDYQNAMAQARRQRRRGGSIIFDAGSLHLEIGGHMGSVFGRAWLKDQLPNGMNLHEIQ